MSNIEIISGLSTGIISAIIFNPIDKAIYVSTTKNVNFLHRENWRNLYKGSSYTIMTRLITSGLYFTYIDYYSTHSKSNSKTALITSIACSITNPLQLIKFNSWYNNYNTRESIKLILNKHGYKGYGIGIFSLLTRDFIFNYIYLSFKQKDNHVNNVLTICGALIIVSPINLIKNKKYASNESVKSIIKNFKFSQLGLSYSLTRIGLGFYISQYLYDLNKYYLNKVK